jgi:S-adenosylmethionine hydrolase
MVLRESWVNIILWAHGRDILAPVAAHLAYEVTLSWLGTVFNDPIRMELTHPEKTDNGWIAHTTLIDLFGNLITDLPASALQGSTEVLVRLRGAEAHGILWP